MAYKPAFPDIKKVLLSHQNIRTSSMKMRSLERFSQMEENSGSGPCNKNCAYCDHLRRTEVDTFKCVKTLSVYKIRQNITCESKDIIYIISCRIHNVQGVGCTTDLKGRLSNYKSHHKKKYISCGITEHFLED